MYNLLSLINGSGKDLGQGGIICIVAIVLVFIILAIIIAITYAISLVVDKYAIKKEKKEETSNRKNVVKSISLDSEDTEVAVLVASIDYRNETKKDVKLVSIKEIK